jgi:glucose/arabinose dehydrogenase
MRRVALVALAGAAALAAVPAAAPGAPQRAAVKTGTVASGLDVPWGVAVLPGGAVLVGERATGRVLLVPPRGGAPREVMRLGDVDPDAGEGGLLGLAISPRYRRDRLVYAYLTTEDDNRIVRFRLGGSPRPILTGLARGTSHDGGRIAFGPDGKLYAGVGDAGDADLAQDLGSLNGKILRMNSNGGVPAGNPFGSLVWSYGHRNVQGLAWDARGRLWATEFGQNTFDEVNVIRPGRNYGWPLVEGRGGTDGGRLTNPAVTWTTDEASPSGAAIVGRTLYVAALRGEALWRVPLNGSRAGTPRRLFAGRWGRLRTVVRVPGGRLLITTSNRDGRGSPRAGDDRILRVRAGG